MPTIETTPEHLRMLYKRMQERIQIVQKRLGRKLTLSEKILFGHLDKPEGQELAAGESILALRPDRVAMQDATAQMALLQYLSAGRKHTAVPTTVHCDHLIRAHEGATADMRTALDDNREVYDFLATASARSGIGFWKPGAGIIHQVVLENYAFPGGLMIGTDSHTPNAGGLGMLAIGVGGADAVDVMAGLPWEVKYPKLIGVHLTGKLKGWSSPKDIICHLCQVLTVKGGTNRILEYFGPGARSISCTGKGTVTNMGAELGATTSVFPFDEAMNRFLTGTQREGLAKVAHEHKVLLEADPDVEKNPTKYFDQVVEIDLSQLEPQVVGPHSPDKGRSLSQLAEEVQKNGWPDKLSAALIGSCTNSSYEDLSRVVELAKQMQQLGIQIPVPFYITPGSDLIYRTIQREGFVEVLESIGGKVLANACGPCIGQWKRNDIQKGQTNSILSSFNRNFPARNDGNPQTLSFITSPEVVLGIAAAGRLSFNPLKDELAASERKKVRLTPPSPAPDIPPKGFAKVEGGYVAPPEEGSHIEVVVSPTSQRLQLLKPFKKWDGKDFLKLPLLMKIRGKCTTDHISPAGQWLKFRGHLDNISDNLFTGAVNDFTGEAGLAFNQLTGKRSEPAPRVARDYKSKELQWIVVGDENYGEGSSREHAAMSPRHLGCAAVIAKSFARIHETNLKKQGILPLVFTSSQDYNKILEADKLSLVGLSQLAPKKPVALLLTHTDGKEEKISLEHSLSTEQIEWFKAGSALNRMTNG